MKPLFFVDIVLIYLWVSYINIISPSVYKCIFSTDIIICRTIKWIFCQLRLKQLVLFILWIWQVTFFPYEKWHFTTLFDYITLKVFVFQVAYLLSRRQELNWYGSLRQHQRSLGYRTESQRWHGIFGLCADVLQQRLPALARP